MKVEMIPPSGDNFIGVQPLDEQGYLHNVRPEGSAAEALRDPHQFAVIRPIPMDETGDLEIK